LAFSLKNDHATPSGAATAFFNGHSEEVLTRKMNWYMGCFVDKKMTVEIFDRV